jgi:hypothetical protein
MFAKCYAYYGKYLLEIRIEALQIIDGEINKLPDIDLYYVFYYRNSKRQLLQLSLSFNPHNNNFGYIGIKKEEIPMGVEIMTHRAVEKEIQSLKGKKVALAFRNNS